MVQETGERFEIFDRSRALVVVAHAAHAASVSLEDGRIFMSSGVPG
jgi:hypothetical protein